MCYSSIIFCRKLWAEHLAKSNNFSAKKLKLWTTLFLAATGWICNHNDNWCLYVENVFIHLHATLTIIKGEKRTAFEGFHSCFICLYIDSIQYYWLSNIISHIHHRWWLTLIFLKASHMVFFFTLFAMDAKRYKATNAAHQSQPCEGNDKLIICFSDVQTNLLQQIENTNGNSRAAFHFNRS